MLYRKKLKICKVILSSEFFSTEENYKQIINKDLGLAKYWEYYAKL